MHNAGKGVIGMKIFGEGAFKEPERRDASLRYVLGLGTVNAFIIGFESTEQVDDLLTRTAAALADLGKRRLSRRHNERAPRVHDVAAKRTRGAKISPGTANGLSERPPQPGAVVE